MTNPPDVKTIVSKAVNKPRAVKAPTKLAPAKADSRPYTLESSNLAADLQRQRDAALSEIEAIDASCLDIAARANRDKQEIQARADVEIAGRRQRADDLGKIVAMANRALDIPDTTGEWKTESGTVGLVDEAPATNTTLALQLERQRQTGDHS